MSATALKVYKVIARDKFEWKMFEGTSGSDWSAIYFQFSIEHALRYATDKISPNGIIALVEFTIPSSTIVNVDSKSNIVGDRKVDTSSPGLTVYRIDLARLGSGSMSGSEKAAMLKKIFGIDAEKKLMKEINGCLIVQDNSEGDMELIISHDVFTHAKTHDTLIQFRHLAQFQTSNHVLKSWRAWSNHQHDHHPWSPLTPLQKLQPHLLASLLS